MRKYHLQNREDYTKYNRMCGYIKNLAARIGDLDLKSGCRVESSAALLQKLYNLGGWFKHVRNLYFVLDCSGVFQILAALQ